jgi:hypothetical protein
MVTLGAGETCSFPVLVQPTAPDVTNFFVFSDGEVFGLGPFVGTATNLDTGKTVKINLAGGFSFVQNSDGTVTVTSASMPSSSSASAAGGSSHVACTSNPDGA